MSVLMLDDFKRLFKDEASYHELIQGFREALANDATIVVVGEEKPLFTARTLEEAQRRLRDRIIGRLITKPALLDQILKGLQDEIVDWPAHG